MKHLYDVHGDIIKTFESDGTTNTIGFSQDCEPVIDMVKRIGDGQQKGQFRFVGSVPLTELMRWCAEDGINIADYWRWPWAMQRQWLYRRFMSSDYRNLRAQ